jgi:hypothetical protein
MPSGSGLTSRACGISDIKNMGGVLQVSGDKGSYSGRNEACASIVAKSCAMALRNATVRTRSCTPKGKERWPMRIAYLFVLALAMTSTAAFAQTAKQKGPAQSAKQTTLQRTVLTNTRTKVLTYYALDPNCSPTGTVTVRILKEPTNGKLETDVGPDFTRYPKNNVLAKCNDKESQVARIWYQSNPNFKGNDEAEFEVIYPDGKARQGRLIITVK